MEQWARINRRIRTLRDFKERLKYHNGPDRIIGEWQIIDVHEIPPQFKKGMEVDFYCCNSRDVFLLNICEGEQSEIEYYAAQDGYKDSIIWLTAKVKIERIDNLFIKQLLHYFMQHKEFRSVMNEKKAFSIRLN
jgi:hypothetical protein